MANSLGRCHQCEEGGDILDRVGSQSGMQMLDYFIVPAPSAEGEIPGSHQKMTVVLGKKDGDLGMEYAILHKDGLDAVVLADAARTLFAERSLYPQHVH